MAPKGCGYGLLSSSGWRSGGTSNVSGRALDLDASPPTSERSVSLAIAPLLLTRASVVRRLARFQCRVEESCEVLPLRR